MKLDYHCHHPTSRRPIHINLNNATTTTATNAMPDPPAVAAFSAAPFPEIPIPSPLKELERLSRTLRPASVLVSSSSELLELAAEEDELSSSTHSSVGLQLYPTVHTCGLFRYLHDRRHHRCGRSDQEHIPHASSPTLPNGDALWSSSFLPWTQLVEID